MGDCEMQPGVIQTSVFVCIVHQPLFHPSSLTCLFFPCGSLCSVKSATQTKQHLRAEVGILLFEPELEREREKSAVRGLPVLSSSLLPATVCIIYLTFT